MGHLPLAESITAKGTLIKTALAFVQERFGAAALEKVLATLDPAVRSKLSGMVLSSSHYPLLTLTALIEAIDRVLGQGDLQVSWEIGKFAGEYEVTLFHKAVFQMGKLELFFRAASVTWGFYYSAGVMKVAEVSERGARLELSEFNPVSKAICFRSGGWMWRTAELCGKKSVTIRHPECLLDGHPACVWMASWS